MMGKRKPFAAARSHYFSDFWLVLFSTRHQDDRWTLWRLRSRVDACAIRDIALDADNPRNQKKVLFYVCQDGSPMHHIILSGSPMRMLLL